MCDLLKKVKMRRTRKMMKLDGMYVLHTDSIVMVTMSRYQMEARAASRKRPSTDWYVLGDSYVCDVVLVGWRQDKYWEITPDGDKLRSFVSYFTGSTCACTCSTCHMSHVAG